MKIVINNCFGGFQLSHDGVMEYAKLAGLKLNAYVDRCKPDGHLNFHKLEPYDGKSDAFVIHYSSAELKPDQTLPEGGYFFYRDIPRDDANLVAVVKKLGKKANGKCASLKIIEIPDGIKWQVEEYDGSEHIAEKHETWS
jgi:hypothetical protein